MIFLLTPLLTSIQGPGSLLLNVTEQSHKRNPEDMFPATHKLHHPGERMAMPGKVRMKLMELNSLVLLWGLLKGLISQKQKQGWLGLCILPGG